MANNLRTVTGTGPEVKTTENGGVHVPHGNVDAVPADPFGTNADAAVETDAAGSLSGKLRGLVKLFAARVPTLGQKAKAASSPVVLASDQGNVRVALPDHMDAFSRIRVSNPYTVFDSVPQYDKDTIHWTEDVTGGSSAVTHLPNESSVRLRCGTAGGDRVTRQSCRYMRYQPGKSLLAFFTFVMGASKANVEKRIGYFDDSNGAFLLQTNAGLSFVVRSFTGGSVSDADAAAQNDWNIDKLNGNGPSGITLNMEKVQILVIDLQWLGAGRVRFGFDINGDVVWAHQFFHANLITSVYMTTANLPLRFEISNSGIAGTTTDLIQICSAILSEGGYDIHRGLQFSASNASTPIAVTTRRPILSIRPKLTFNGIANRGWVIPINVFVASNTNAGFVEVVRGGALTNASFSSVHADSIAERDVAATAITGGRVLMSRYVPAAADYDTVEFEFHDDVIPLSLLDIPGSTQDVLTVVLTSLNQTCNALASVNWEEIR